MNTSTSTSTTSACTDLLAALKAAKGLKHAADRIEAGEALGVDF